METKQVSVFVENKVGRLVAILEALERRGVNIQGLSVNDAAENGIVRMIMAKPEEGLEELRQSGFVARIDSVISCNIPHVPGGLLQNVAKPIAEAGINVHYMYAYTDSTTGKAIAIIKTDDIAKAESVLASH